MKNRAINEGIAVWGEGLMLCYLMALLANSKCIVNMVVGGGQVWMLSTSGAGSCEAAVMVTIIDLLVVCCRTFGASRLFSGARLGLHC